MEQEQKVAEDARIAAERDAAEQKHAAHMLQVNFGKTSASSFLKVLLSWWLSQFLMAKKADAYFRTFYMQEKYEAAMAALSQMEKRAVMAETMLEATKQYQAGQVKANQSFTSRYVLATFNFHFPSI